MDKTINIMKKFINFWTKTTTIPKESIEIKWLWLNTKWELLKKDYKNIMKA
jgi:hypothetical protein